MNGQDGRLKLKGRASKHTVCIKLATSGPGRASRNDRRENA
jgi:hypothetical protein